MIARTLLITAVSSLALLAGPARAQPQSATAAAGIAEGKLEKGVRTVEMQVTDDGFVPDKIKASKGEKLRLVITRKTDRTCATEIVIKDYGVNTKLPLEKTVTVEVTPKKSGEIRYACGMDMIGGVILVP